jgi:hypothetical protein
VEIVPREICASIERAATPKLLKSVSNCPDGRENRSKWNFTHKLAGPEARLGPKALENLQSQQPNQSPAAGLGLLCMLLLGIAKHSDVPIIELILDSILLVDSLSSRTLIDREFSPQLASWLDSDLHSNESIERH